MRPLVAVVLLVALTTIGVVAADARLSDSPSGRIVFESNRAGDWTIFAVNADGSGLRRVTTGNAEYPVPSPDESRVAFTRYQDLRNGSVVAEVHVADLASGLDRRIA